MRSVPEPPGQDLQHVPRDLRVLLHRGADLVAVEHQAPDRRLGGDLRGARPAVEHGHIAEEVTGAEPPKRPPSTRYPGFPFEDDEHGLAGRALLHQGIAWLELVHEGVAS